MKVKELLEVCNEKDVNILSDDAEMVIATMTKDCAIELLGDKEVEAFNTKTGIPCLKIGSPEDRKEAETSSKESKEDIRFGRLKIGERFTLYGKTFIKCDLSDAFLEIGKPNDAAFCIEENKVWRFRHNDMLVEKVGGQR